MAEKIIITCICLNYLLTLRMISHLFLLKLKEYKTIIYGKNQDNRYSYFWW